MGWLEEPFDLSNSFLKSACSDSKGCLDQVPRPLVSPFISMNSTAWLSTRWNLLKFKTALTVYFINMSMVSAAFSIPLSVNSIKFFLNIFLSSVSSYLFLNNYDILRNLKSPTYFILCLRRQQSKATRIALFLH